MVLHDIAVGIDGSRTASDALNWAVGLASHSDGCVHAINAWSVPQTCIYPDLVPRQEELEQHAETLVQESVRDIDNSILVQRLVVEGAAGPALVSQTRTTDLLVVGRTGQHLVHYAPHFGEVLAGSTTRYCATHCAGPVAVIPKGSKWVDAPHVVVGIDGSPNSLDALRWAASALPADASLHALTALVLEPPDLGTPIDAELLDPLVDRQREELRATVNTAIEASMLGGRTVSIHVVAGYPPDALVDPGFRCDLIVLGAHSESPSPGVLGSVADHTLRHATVPLVVVRT